MKRLAKILVFLICNMLLRSLSCYAGIEQFVKYMNPPFTANHSTFTNQDTVFQNPAYTWNTINNISVQDAVTLQVIDSVLITNAFSYSVTLSIKYYTNPDTVAVHPTTISQTLTVNYDPAHGVSYKGIDSYNFTGAYKIVVLVTSINSHGTTPPTLSLRLNSSIVINRKYPFTASTAIAPAYSFSHNSEMLGIAWPKIRGAEEYDLEWATINDGNDDFAIINSRYNNPGQTNDAAVTAALTRIFRNNASRVTTSQLSYTLSLLSTDTYAIVRIRQVQYLPNGVRQTGNWNYKRIDTRFAIEALVWHQPYLNWQYSSAYAEDGKKKEVVSYFDGSLRGRQTVTLDNTDNIALAQENIYDQFGRPEASILPAPFVDSSGTAYLHYNVNFNKNGTGTAYNLNNLNTLGSYCEWLPDSMSTVSGASKYYSSRNAFYNHGTITNKKLYNSYIPNADRFPLSATEYTADNTGRIKVQGGVGLDFQTGLTTASGFSHTTKYYYGKPEQDELDMLFGNDAGFAEHYLKNMVVDPNGQVSLSYINASGKTIATALTGSSPSTLDTITSYTGAGKLTSLHILKPEQFTYSNADMTLTANTTYLNAVIDTGRLAFSIQKLIDKFPGGADSICSNCFYQMSIKVTDDCGETVYRTTTPVHIGKSVSNCVDSGLYSSSQTINFQHIGEYYVNIQFALNKDTINYFTNNFITKGTANGYIQAEAAYIKQHYLDSLEVSGCYKDCTTCYANLGTQANFVNKVQRELISLELDSVAVKGTDFTNWMTSLYTRLIDSCAASQAHCYDLCQSVENAMELDVSPDGQYALFDTAGVALEPTINVIAPNWRTVFPMLSSSSPIYKANQFTDTTGKVNSPNDGSFRLIDLINNWQSGWAIKFLQYHPEYCKLVFCDSMSAYKTWDLQVQQIDQAANVNRIPGGSTLVYKSTNASDWLLPTDTFFKSTGPGAAYYSQMQADLVNYSKNVMNLHEEDSLVDKNIMQVIDYDLYCSDTSWRTNSNTHIPKEPWNYCTPNASCRVSDREWREYRDYYLELKQKYYTILQNASCGLLCPIGQPLSYSLPVGAAPSNNDFTISPDTGKTTACAGQQSVVIQRTSTAASLAAKTLTIYYPPGLDTTTLTHSVHFNAKQLRKTFCVPNNIPISSILIQNPVIPPPVVQKADTVMAFVHNYKFRMDSTCYVEGHIAGQRIIYANYISLTTRTGQPATVGFPVTVEVQFTRTINGSPTTTYDTTFNVATGDSTSRITYYYYSNFGPPGCVLFSQYPNCVESVYGALLYDKIDPTGNIYAKCAEFSQTIPQPPPPLNCPQAYSSKTSRFPTVTTTTTAVMDSTAARAQSNAALAATQQQAGDICSGNIATLIDSLKAGLTGHQADTLTKYLNMVCTAGVDFTHGSGVSDIIGDKNHGTTPYNSFAAVLKAKLSLTYFSPTLNPWLTPGPYPYNSQQQSTPKTISNSNSAICSLLSTLSSRASAAGKSLFNYITDTYGPAMTLSQHDLDTLQKSCSTCRFMLGYDITLPVFLDPGETGCVKRTTYNTSVDTLMRVLFNNSLDTTRVKGQNIFTNYMNQRFGFALNYEDYSTYKRLLVTDTAATLCNEMPFTTATIDSNSCLNNALEIAVANGKAAYDNYIDSLKAAFQVSYVNTCKLAQANASIISKQQTYHYTLYYYDQADNLVRTIPPEGINLVDSSKFAVIDTTRAHEAIKDCQTVYDSFAPPNIVNTTATKNTAFNALANAIGAGASRAVEFWLYNPMVAGAYPNNQVVEQSANHNYLFNLCISGGRLNIDIYKSAVAAGTAGITYSLTNHFAANIGSLPLNPWTNIVLQGPNLSSGALTCYFNGKQLTPLSGTQPCNCGVTITGETTAITYSENNATVKTMRIYNRLMTPLEILTNAGDECLTPSNITSMAWYRFHVPAVGDSTTVAGNTSDESTLMHYYPLHIIPTNYVYNSTNQVSQQLSPDGGTNSYWYDLLSRLTVSQNAKQLPLNNYSYTAYDAIGRIIKVGQKQQTTLNIGTPHYLTADTIATFYTAGIDSQITKTYYDTTMRTVTGHTDGIATVSQYNLRKRVSASTYQDLQAGPVQNATYYSYDIDGNVQTLYQQVNGLYIPSTNAGLKRIDYEYDLVSGKVNFVRYQDGQADNFYYSYTYDADNRLTNAWSGTLALVDTLTHSVLIPGNGKRDAHYEYYLHGPLARMELGDTLDRVQGVDYAYTLQGWLKGINSNTVLASVDMGRDSLHVAKDAYGYSLNYYSDGTSPNDYDPISGTYPFKTIGSIPGFTAFSPLYNGNIMAIGNNISQLTDPWHYYIYRYDQLNRLKATAVYKTTPSSFTRVSDYHENFTYDGNGNIKTAYRYAGAATRMDSLTYHYNTTGGRLNNNKLNYIHDDVSSHNWPYGLDNQTTGNYHYDLIGNMVSDLRDTISNVGWSVYGKIMNLTNSVGTINYSYDPAGQRVTKIASGITTYYVRDAQGNTLALYDNRHSQVNLKEFDLYGSGRLGMWQPNFIVVSGSGNELTSWDTVGHKEYELNNYLSNVLITITDRRLQHSTDGVNVDWFNADVATSQEYYAFGGLMPGRTYTDQDWYRYGFNGQERQDDINGIGNHNMAEFWEYDTRVGRRWNLDPKPEVGVSLYSAFENNPIFNTDFLGDTISVKSDWTAAGHMKFSMFYFNALEGTQDPKRNCNMCCLVAIASNLSSLYGSNFKVVDNYDLATQQVKAQGYKGDREVAKPSANGRILNSYATNDDFLSSDFKTGIVDNIVNQMKGHKGQFVFGVGVANNYHSTIIVAYNNGEALTDPKTLLTRMSSEDNPLFMFVEDGGGARLMDAKQLESKLQEYVIGAAHWYSGKKSLNGQRIKMKHPHAVSINSNVDNLEAKK